MRTPDGAHIAYAVSGNRALDLVTLLGWPSHIEAIWTFPPAARFFRRLESFSRLIRWDPRGAGLSDRPESERWPALEVHARDLVAVLDAVESDEAALYANSTYGLLGIFFAATYPERVSRLVLDGCYARFAYADDFPIGVAKDLLDRMLGLVGSQDLERGIVDGGIGRRFTAPSTVDDPELAAEWDRLMRLTNSPATSHARGEAAVYSDVRPLLGSISAPTLVLYRTGDRLAGKTHAEYLAEHISGAQLVALPGVDNTSILGDQDLALAEIEEFFTGRRSGPETKRVLATVLFTDIVQSTDRVAELGDRRWRDLLDRHDDAARDEINRYEGRFIKTTGDGVVATFDGPARGVRCAQAITRRATALGLDVRSGLHTGEVEFRGDDLHGLAIHVAQRVSSSAKAGEVLVSRTVVDLVAGSDLTFEDRGEHTLKGVPGSWTLFLAPATT